jgi:hypothetical protein
MGYVKIQDRDHLYRDINSGAILNTNKAEFEQYYADRELDMRKLQERQALENKVNKSTINRKHISRVGDNH